MHAYHDYAAKTMLTTCPSCLRPAEIIDRFTLPSTDGPATHVKVRCQSGHWYTLLVGSTASYN